MSLIKYRIREVAKDFGMPTKAVMELYAKYFGPAKNHMQVLAEDQLNLIFDVITRENQVGDMQEALAAQSAQRPAPKPETAGTPAPKAPAPAQAEEKPAEKSGEKPAAKPQKAQQQPSQPQAQQQRPQQQQQQPAKPKQPQRKRERRVVDTSAVTVNASRFDDHADTLVSERMQNAKGGKQRIGGKQGGNNKRRGGQSSKRRSEEQEKMRRLQLEIAKKAPLVVKIPDEITVGELASRMKKTAAEVIKQLIRLGVMAAVNQTVDYDTAALVAMELGCKVEKEVVVTIEEQLIDDREDRPEELVPRSPVVVVMGHVDHGKTSLLDAIRKTNVVQGEAGGITQHIGAYQVEINGQNITFLDTPGHAAFTAMRERGAMCTDIAILVVAADDGIMPQTVEAINHAKAANIPIIVAINKMDKPGANPDKIKQQIMEYELVPEEYGGDTIMVPISAKRGDGIDTLLEMVLLTAEMQELKANPDRRARGTVIEARLDKARGPIATLLVQNGTLRQGDIIIAGTAVGRVRVMTNAKGKTVKTAGPSVPVEITGLGEVPGAGDTFNAVEDERMARQLVVQRKAEEKARSAKKLTKVTLDELFAQIQEGSMKELNIVVKADVQGSAEAVKASLLKLSNEEVRVKVIHAGVGAINESDVLLASTANAIIVGFNVRPDAVATASAQRSHVDMRMYRVIYDCIGEIEAAMKGMLDPKFREAVTGHAEVRQLYKVSSVGTIAGCFVKDGKVTRDAQVRVLRDNVVVHEGVLGSLQRFKDSVKEVAAGYECGMTVERFNDIKEGDVFECFVMEQIKE